MEDLSYLTTEYARNKDIECYEKEERGKQKKMISRQSIIDAYLFLRKNNNSIPDSTLDFIKDASLSVYDKINGEWCKECINNGNQMIYPSGCTGCGNNGEARNFIKK